MSGTVVGKNKLNGFLDSVATLATILVCALLAWTIWTQRQGSSRSTARATEPPPQDPITIDGAQTKGSPVAKAVMVLYSDFQCPFCGSVARDRVLDRVAGGVPVQTLRDAINKVLSQQ
jgi:hypothetical protein